MSLSKSKRGDDELPHNKLLKTEEVSLEHSKLDLITKKDEEILREYHRQLAANVPMVKTLFKIGRVELSIHIQKNLSLWPQEIRIKDPKRLDLGKHGGEYCDDCRMFPFASSGYATVSLMLIILGDFFDSYLPKTPGLNFQCYALSRMTRQRNNKITDSGFEREDDLRQWVRHILKSDLRLFFTSDVKDIESDTKILRRCLFLTIYAKMGGDWDGHVFVLMIQKVGNGPIEVVIVDNIHSSYYPDHVHTIIQTIAEREIYEVAHENNYYNAKVLLIAFRNTKRLKYQEPWMQCISVALRSCIYLSLVKDYRNIQESPEDFEHHTEFFGQHLRRMINWIHTYPLIQSQAKVPIISQRMTKQFFLINTHSCCLVLADPISVSHIPNLDNKRLVNSIYRLCSPIPYGFHQNGEEAFELSEYEGGNMCRTMSKFLYLT
jgi:hypothetical protein